MNDGPFEELEHEAEAVYQRLRDDLLGRDGYLAVLLLTIAAIVVIPLDDAYRAGRIVTASVLGLLVGVTMTRSKVHRHLRAVSLTVAGLAVVLAVILTILDTPISVPDDGQVHWGPAIGSASYTMVLALCFGAILRRAFAHRRVTLNTVAAAIAAYLVIGLVFMSAFRAAGYVHGPFFSQAGVNGFTFEYFSFITLTTTGYGDFTAANDAGRTLAMFEALMGQVFLVTIVALVVSNLGQERTVLARRRLREAPEDGVDADDPDDDPDDHAEDPSGEGPPA